MHRLSAELGNEPQAQQVKITVDKTVQTKLRCSVFAGLMVHHLLADACKTRILGKIRNIAVHLAINLDVFNHILAISLQTAVEIMQIRDTAHLARRGIEKLCRNRFRQRVVALLLPSRHKVVAILHNHPIKLRNLVRAVLKVGVHSNNHIALGAFESHVKRRRLAIVATETNSLHSRTLCLQVVDNLPRSVSRAIVDKNNLIREPVGFHHAFNPRLQFRQRFRLVIQRNYNRYIHKFFLVRTVCKISISHRNKKIDCRFLNVFFDYPTRSKLPKILWAIISDICEQKAVIYRLWWRQERNRHLYSIVWYSTRLSIMKKFIVITENKNYRTKSHTSINAYNVWNRNWQIVDK